MGVVWFEDTTENPDRSGIDGGIQGLPVGLLPEFITVLEAKKVPEFPDLIASCLIGEITDKNIQALRAVAYEAGTIAWVRVGASHVDNWISGAHTLTGETIP